MNPTLEEMNAAAATFEVKGSELLTDEQERHLISLVQSGDTKSLERLVECEIRFVFTVAEAYQDKGVEMSDLIATGTKGLVIAAQKYDISAEYRFTTYAIWWVRNEMLKVINK